MSTISNSPMVIVRPKVDYSLAETYLPAVILWCKTMAYTCIVPCFWYADANSQLSVAGIFVIFLYYDHIYLNPCRFIDTTAISVDVIAASILTLARDANSCMWCSVNIAIWFVLGGAHIFSPAEFPKIIMHVASAVIMVAELALSRPIPEHNKHTPLDFFAAFMRTNMYTVLVILDIYLIRHCRQSDNDRTYIFRYGSVLLSTWPLTCVYTLILAALQATYIYHQYRKTVGDHQGQSLPTYEKASLLTPNQLRATSLPPQLQQQQQLSILPMTSQAYNNKPAASNGIVERQKAALIDSSAISLPQDIHEAFKLAQQQHAAVIISKNA